MKKILLLSIATLFGAGISAQNVPTPLVTDMGIKLFDYSKKRTEIILPEVKGYTCYKADFHVHTIYSDGNVPPRERVDEAWYDGLDIIALTDHLEKRSYEKFMLKALAPYSKDGEPFVYAHAGAGNTKDNDAPMLCNLNAAYQEAADHAIKNSLPIMVVRGTEIWRNARTVGEYNAIFLKDINAICHKDLFESFRRAKEQGGIIIHNHPGWRRTTMDKSEEQKQIYAEKWVDGVEVVNSATLYPQIMRRCVDEKLFMAANTDTHHPTSQLWGPGSGIFRTMTFVLAKEKSEEAIKEALLARRTICYCANNLMGEQKWLQEFFDAAVECKVVARNEEKKSQTCCLTNHCSIPFVLHLGNSIYTLKPFHSIQVSTSTKGGRKPEFVVDNMWTVDEKHPKLTIDIDK